MKNRNNKKQQLDFGKDIEPLIKKYHLENNDDCKEAVGLIKKDDPKGYNQLGNLLSSTGLLTRTENKTVIKMFEKAVEMGYKRSYFNLGISYYFGAGVKRDVNRGVNMIKVAFLSGFSQVFNNYPLDSIESVKLLFVHDCFYNEIMNLLKASSSSTKEQEEVLELLCNMDEIITQVYENGVSINNFVH
jgi:hypothetical protein